MHWQFFAVLDKQTLDEMFERKARDLAIFLQIILIYSWKSEVKQPYFCRSVQRG